MVVNYKKMPFGLKSICEYLGIEDDKAIFFHSLSFDSKDKMRRNLNSGKMSYAEIFSFACNEGPKFASCYYNKKLIHYLDERGLINKERLLLLGEERKVEYPYNSVSRMFWERLQWDKELRKELEGYTVVSSFLGSDDEKSAEMIHGKTLMRAEDQVKFDSKWYMRMIASKYDFSIPFGVAFCGLNALEDAILNLREHGVRCAWIKLESLFSGSGNLYVDDLTKVDEIRRKLEKLSQQFYGMVFDKDYLDNELHFVIEEDLSDMEVFNIGVEAVVADSQVTVLGGVAQKTENGIYRGSYYDEMVEANIGVALKAAEKLFVAYQKEGYRGCITVDVLVTNDGKAYNIDPNARFSAGSMLLKNIHVSEYYTGKKMYGLSFTNSIPVSGDLVDDVFDYIGEYLYRGSESDYQGIIPALLNDVHVLEDGRYYLKTVVVADSYEKACWMYQKFKERIRRVTLELDDYGI